MYGPKPRWGHSQRRRRRRRCYSVVKESFHLLATVMMPLASENVTPCLSLSILALSCLAFFYFVALKLPAGLPRLLALLPLLPPYLLLPWITPFYHTRGIVSFLLLWTSPSKLLLLCWDASIDPPPWIASSFSHFLFAVLLPVKVRHTQPKARIHPKYHLGRVALWRFVALVCLLNVYPFADSFPLPVLYLMYSVHVYLAAECVLGLLAKLMSTVFHVDLDPQFDNPLMSSSLSEFWGKRWNIVVTSILRATVYNPLLHLLSEVGRRRGKETTPAQRNGANAFQKASSGYFTSKATVKQQSNEATGSLDCDKLPLWTRSAAILATFSVSGLFHELIFYYFTRTEATGEVTAFFLLNGLAVCVEVTARRAMRRHHARLPKPISVLITIAFVCTTAALLFLPPLHRSGATTETIAEYHKLQRTLLATLNVREESVAV